MEVSVQPCPSAQLPLVIAAVDQEFIFSKGRAISLGRRFPNVLSENNLEHILIAEYDGALCGATVIKVFDYACRQRTWRGAMVGMVWVDPRCRGLGVGRELMAEAERALHAEGLDFGVLWTGIPAFYERNGWFTGDISVFSEVKSLDPTENLSGVNCGNLAVGDWQRLEVARSSLAPPRVLRNPRDYQVIPVPAASVQCFSASAAGSEGYALVGEADGTGYLYEIVAPPSLWDPLWTAIGGRFRRLFVNGKAGDLLAEWMAKEKKVLWERQGKTMWLPLSRDAVRAPLATWYIPYFDRI